MEVVGEECSVHFSIAINIYDKTVILYGRKMRRALAEGVMVMVKNLDLLVLALKV